MTAKRKRLLVLEAAHAARAARHSGHTRTLPGADTLCELARRVCLALPEDLQACVTVQGARGYAELLEAYWRLGFSGNGEDLAAAARQAYALAFEGQA
ncbi:hypothetical protein [Deinococcus sp. YIM 77859]|uniref:hypothetical protein n=1 Tax=Deinococcus sp. YIM 77859 TaxID=1540221 RepID=UPI0005565471|nr:hypothetical protein [Deinococcus sp. YIM 77859]